MLTPSPSDLLGTGKVRDARAVINEHFDTLAEAIGLRVGVYRDVANAAALVGLTDASRLDAALTAAGEVYLLVGVDPAVLNNWRRIDNGVSPAQLQAAIDELGEALEDHELNDVHSQPQPSILVETGSLPVATMQLRGRRYKIGTTTWYCNGTTWINDGGSTRSVNTIEPDTEGNITLPLPFVKSVDGLTPNGSGDVDLPAFVKSVDGLTPDVNGDVDLPAYVKTVDGLTPNSSGDVDLPAFVKSVNSTQPDGGGNVVISIPSVPDATSTVKGLVQLTNNLRGSSTAPEVLRAARSDITMGLARAESIPAHNGRRSAHGVEDMQELLPSSYFGFDARSATLNMVPRGLTEQTLTSGVVYLASLNQLQDWTASKLLVITGATTPVGCSLFKIGIYLQSGDTSTLIGSTPEVHASADFATANRITASLMSVATKLNRQFPYEVAVLQVGGSPTFWGSAVPFSSLVPVVPTPKMLTGQTDLPTTFSRKSTNASFVAASFQLLAGAVK